MPQTCRRFLASAGGTAFGLAFWQQALQDASAATTAGVGSYGPLQAPDANGLAPPRGFTSRVVARTGAPVAGTGHVLPDGATTSPLPDAGWVHVIDAEVPSLAAGRLDVLLADEAPAWCSRSTSATRCAADAGARAAAPRAGAPARPPPPALPWVGSARMNGILDDKVAIVTGSARGIGRATAELLIAHGAKVVVNDLDADVAQQTASELGGETVVSAGDLTKSGQPEALVQSAIDAWGKIDIIVNNAGYTIDAPVHKITDEMWDRMLDIHLKVPFQVVRAAAPHLREPAKAERAEGREVFRKIVNVSSTSGVFGNAGQANYAAGKAGVQGLTRTLAKEWGQFKVNCNAVAFGYIETRLTASKDEGNTMEVDGQQVQLGIPDQLREMAKMLIPLGRAGTPEEAAGGIFFLCSPWSNYVHGQTLLVTGGQFTGMGS